MSHPVMQEGKVALITGGAAGIGLAAAKAFAARGMSVAIADLREELLADAEAEIRTAGAARVLARRCDVSDRADVDALRDAVIAELGGIDLLMSNAGIGPDSDVFDKAGTWERLLAVNLWGVLNCCQSIVPGMLERGGPGMVINTGSKQGITTPPGNPAYNVSKAGVKAYTEALAHDLRERGADISVHLLIPGFVFTDINRGDRTDRPPGAWTPKQLVEFMMPCLEAGDFYILCPDNDVDRETDAKRMAWATGDIIENRPPLSRWHKDWAARFEDSLK